MIDVKLIQKAKPMSEEIASIDRSWREHMTKVEAAGFTLPFDGKYNAVIDENAILVEGYCGPLLIDRLTGNENTYLLSRPIRCDPFRVYGVWDKKRLFQYFTSKPVLGFHYLGLERNGVRTICTGDLEYTTPGDIASLQEVCSRMVRSFRVIYIDSLGNIFVPEEHGRIKEILQSRGCRSVSTLLEEKWIKEIL